MPIKRIIQGLNQFQNTYFSDHQQMFEELSHGQTPEILFITCCDSRINPNLLTQTKPGELFIVRNIGNMIPPYGMPNNSEGAAIEYAILSLNIKHIVICGHSDCGSMKGILKMNKLEKEAPLVYQWLKNAEATRRLLHDNYQGYEEEELLTISIQENVLTQIKNLETYPVVRSRLHGHQLYLHAWFYEIETGIISAYDANQSKFVPLCSEPVPVPNPLSTRQQA